MICKFKGSSFKRTAGGLENVREGWLDGSIRLDRDYRVYALGTYLGDNKALIDPADDGRPGWYSLRDMDVLDPAVPAGWQILLEDGAHWSMIMGYEQLVASPTHFDGLLERDESELSVFRAVKERRSPDAGGLS